MSQGHQLQLNPPIPVDVIHKGKMQSGVALLVTNYGPEHHRVWTVCLDEDGSMWDKENPMVRGTKNITHGRRLAEPPQGATEKAILDTMKAKRSGFAVAPELEAELKLPAYLRKPDRSTDHDGNAKRTTSGPSSQHHPLCGCTPCRTRKSGDSEAKEAAQKPGEAPLSRKCPSCQYGYISLHNQKCVLCGHDGYKDHTHTSAVICRPGCPAYQADPGKP